MEGRNIIKVGLCPDFELNSTIVEEIANLFSKNVTVWGRGINIRIISSYDNDAMIVSEIIRTALNLNDNHKIECAEVTNSISKMAEKYITGVNTLIIVRKRSTQLCPNPIKTEVAPYKVGHIPIFEPMF
jgi:hypothetical protein